MPKDILSPEIAREQLSQHQSELETALLQLAKALGVKQDFINEQFFNDFMMWSWDPFEEMCTECNKQTAHFKPKLQALDTHLESNLSPQLYEVFQQYIDLRNSKEAAMLNSAFLMGYQTAFRFLMMGLFSPAKIYAEEEAQNSDKE